MSARFWVHDGDEWVDFTDRINMREPPTLSEKAEEGSVAMSQLVIYDPDMDIEIAPFSRFAATETTSESDDEVWMAGFIMGRRVGRIGGTFLNPLGRFWACDVTDANERWHRRVLKGSDANRGEETDNERVTWLLNEMVGWGFVDDDTEYVSSGAESGDLDAEDLRGRYPDEVMGQVAEAKSKNWWLQRQGSMPGLTDYAWWGRDGVSTYESPLYLTNDPADINPNLDGIRGGTSLVYPLRRDHGLRCIPERLYSGMYARHRSGTIYRTDADTIDLIGRRDMVMSGTEQMTKARAITRATRYLEDFGAEEFRVEGRVRLPASKVTQLRAGMRVPVKMTHWPYGLDEWLFWRVVMVAVTPAPAGPWYDVDLELVSTGDAASGPPAPPFDGEAIAALIGWQGNGNPASYGSQTFQWTGDAPGAGYSLLPTDGPLTPVAGVAGVFGITAGAPMTVRICGEVFVTASVSASESITLNILVNGVVVASDTESINPSGAQSWTPHLLVDAGGIALAEGDVVTMNTRVANDGFLAAVGDNSTIKNSSMLIVGRGTHTNIPTGSTFYYGGTPWVGP